MMGDFVYYKKTIRDVPVKNKRVLVRVDFNVPMDQTGKISDDTRIRGAVPTIQYLKNRGAKVILMSHLGRPKGKVVPELSLQPVAKRLAQAIDTPVAFCPDCVGPEAQNMAAALQPGELLLLENLRFHPEEEKNDPAFAKALAALAELYVDDAFGTVHRSHASMEGVGHHLPAVSGLLLEKELAIMGKTLEDPNRPFVAIMGGAKISDKIGVIRNLLKKVDRLLIGGAMASTFLAAQGYDMQQSKVDPDSIAAAKTLLENDIERKICLPMDLLAAEAATETAARQNVALHQVPKDWQVLDIGEKTILSYAKIIAAAKTVVWNGPMGMFELKPFSRGTRKVALAVARTKATTIVGGGDSISALEHAGVSYLVNHVSTGGGSTLAYLEGSTLPGLTVLEDLDMKDFDVLRDIEE